MRNVKNSFKAIALLSICISNLAFAISTELKATVDWETRGNAVAVRSNSMVKIQHYDIPLRLLGSNISSTINPKTAQSLIFKKNGEKYVRWVINPEDTKWHLEIEKFLVENNLPIEKHSFFEGYKTASRSYIVVNPETKAEFSIKVSTNVTGGNWTDKKQTFEDALQIRMIMDYINGQIAKTGDLKNAILLDEPAVFGIKSLDQGMVIRAYDKVANSGHRYVPGFSIVHEKVGRDLAKLNGSDDPAGYWNEHYNKPLARALAEFVALTGVTYDSPHSQNFMVEIDANNKPTGKIVLRDFGDSYLARPYFEAAGRPDIPQKWERGNVKPFIAMGVGILHGNKSPSWLSVSNGPKMPWIKINYNTWAVDFYREYQNEFKKQTGIELKSFTGKYTRSDLYFLEQYSLGDPIGANFLDLVRHNNQRLALKIGTCELVF